MVCSGSNTKLLVVGTRELHNSKLIRNDITIGIVVDGCKVTESWIERRQGIIVNNTLTWKHHLYGNDENTGLINKLSYRAGLVFTCQE